MQRSRSLARCRKPRTSALVEARVLLDSISQSRYSPRFFESAHAFSFFVEAFRCLFMASKPCIALRSGPKMPLGCQRAVLRRRPESCMIHYCKPRRADWRHNTASLALFAAVAELIIAYKLPQHFRGWEAPIARAPLGPGKRLARTPRVSRTFPSGGPT
jgi:hypothetical protein